MNCMMTFWSKTGCTCDSGPIDYNGCEKFQSFSDTVTAVTL